MLITSSVPADHPLQAVPQDTCVVCGRNSPHGLHLQFHRDPDGAVAAEWCPTPGWEGFEGIVHGGIVATVLDEAMSKAVASLHCAALTGELRVRFHHRVTPGEP